jgi:hypothetical protein
MALDLFKQARLVSDRIRNGKRWHAYIVSEPYEFTYDDLAQLADVAGSRDIVIEYEQNGSGYSEYTPGDNSHCDVIVYLRPAD